MSSISGYVPSKFVFCQHVRELSAFDWPPLIHWLHTCMVPYYNGLITQEQAHSIIFWVESDFTSRTKTWTIWTLNLEILENLTQTNLDNITQTNLNKLTQTKLDNLTKLIPQLSPSLWIKLITLKYTQHRAVSPPLINNLSDSQ